MKHIIFAFILSAITIALFSMSIYAAHTISFRDMTHNYEVAGFFAFFSILYGIATSIAVREGIRKGSK